MYVAPYVKFPILFSDKLVSVSFQKVLQYQVPLMSFHWEPSCSIRKDGQTGRRTDMTKVIVAFRNSKNASIRSVTDGSDFRNELRNQTQNMWSVISNLFYEQASTISIGKKISIPFRNCTETNISRCFFNSSVPASVQWTAP
jgi:hypothetical protein